MIWKVLHKTRQISTCEYSDRNSNVLKPTPSTVGKPSVLNYSVRRA
ncbi:hypothetical protein I2492_17550 [Budviciaceae bacterium CWB-B4]|uniref:Uncharacterized protein n=1 Tax=Limnobaculum xujianqingii TaxID=2738837 RepID=A0A9D7FW63_9GAMM|nr:hypothetical protein [Limnobaculum xujianqingii]MBK5074817.1 hypothetical protein [Limnobaculum xujianqingii]MBK5178127.1 hypothetical protein [Limnobaculum xujianqingii]